MSELPILYSFRRCPYAMRARMGLKVSGGTCELREVVLRDKPESMLEVSPKGEVPVLVIPGGEVIDESLDVMLWFLRQNDPENWLRPENGDLEDMLGLIEKCESEFKPHLDRYKYANRYEGADPFEHRGKAEEFLCVLEEKLVQAEWLFGSRMALADMAIAPFIRQFANTDRVWFDAAPWPRVQRWLATFLALDVFTSIMPKFAKWHPGDETVLFPTP